MKTVIETNKFIINLLGEQKIDYNNKYRLSKYSLLLNYKNATLIYNTMTKQLCVLNECEADKIINNHIFTAENVLIPLIKNWLLVSVDTNEKKLNDQLVSIAKYTNNNHNITNFVIFPTTDCNARCYYCFEMGYKRINMQNQTAIDVANYIIKVSNGNKVKLNWFGGEPLFNAIAIDTICTILGKHNINYSSHMTSNGFLFNDENIKKIKNLWHLRSVQITLDGTEKIYNKTKSYIYHDITNPFEIVYRNIGKLLENDIFVKIRLNMDLHNIDDLYTLVDILNKDYGNFKKLKIYPAILFEEIGADKIQRNDIQRKAVYDAYMKLCEHLLKMDKLNLIPLSRQIKTNRCMADNDQAIQILPNGNLGKCEHYTDCEFIGSIYNDEKNAKVIESWKKRKKENEFCDQCVYYPNCIRLEKCKNGTPYDCIEEEREKELFYLKASIFRTYDLWLKGKLNSFDTQKE